MENRVIAVGSVTNATRGKKILEQAGIRAYINRSLHPAKTDGCGYSLLVPEKGEEAVRILRNNGIRIRRVSEE